MTIEELSKQDFERITRIQPCSVCGAPSMVLITMEDEELVFLCELDLSVYREFREEIEKEENTDEEIQQKLI